MYWIAHNIAKDGVSNIEDNKLLRYIEITKERIQKDIHWNNSEQSVELNATLSLLTQELDKRTS